MKSPPRVRSRGFYRTVLVLPILMLTALFATGRLQAYRAIFTSLEPPPSDAMQSHFLTAVLWAVSIIPFLFASWEIGYQHTAARRLGYSLVIGAREVARLALGRDILPEALAGYSRSPRDRPGTALAMGSAAGIFLPAFFLFFIPTFRTPLSIFWLCGAGLFYGAQVYCSRRASAYLVAEPRQWDLFHPYRLLNPAGYEPAGQVFVRCRIIAMVAMAVWWLGGGAAIITRS